MLRLARLLAVVQQHLVHLLAVAGAARGSGLAIARCFAAEGAGVTLIDRDAEVKAAARRIEEDYRVTALSLVADVTDFEAMRRAAAEVAAAFGRTDHMVFAVGMVRAAADKFAEGARLLGLPE